eukprot:Opistho-2@96304
MSVAEAPCYTLINPLTDAEGQTEQQLRKELEAGTPEVKTAALKRLIVQMINGDRFPSLLMIIVKFVMPLRDHIVKKLLLLYWEILPKTGTDGKLLREMILVCDAYRKDLQHPNEFIRGSTLRFLCKLKAPELLEPVMPAIRACLEHRHAYVRRNAVLAIFTIHKNFENLIPDAPELIQNFLIAEQDMSCKRNAFMMLVHVDQPRALDYLATVNQTGDTLQSLSLELATLGDLKLVERPTAYTLGPHDVCNIRANVKVSSTENGIIFGNIVYDLTGSSSDRNCVVLNDIHIDVMDYITPGDCTDADFRRMWVEFEWENKVAVATVCTDLNQYLRHIIGSTNMRCLTPESALAGDCGFLAANLYARSIFGEDALANVSIERTAEGKIAGHIRIRSKTQGIALSLGDKITHNQEVIAA